VIYIKKNNALAAALNVEPVVHCVMYQVTDGLQQNRTTKFIYLLREKKKKIATSRHANLASIKISIY
jgi:hypothetical protein